MEYSATAEIAIGSPFSSVKEEPVPVTLIVDCGAVAFGEPIIVPPSVPPLQNPQGRQSLCSAVPHFLVRSEVERRPCVAYVWPLNMRAIVIV